CVMTRYRSTGMRSSSEPASVISAAAAALRPATPAGVPSPAMRSSCIPTTHPRGTTNHDTSSAYPAAAGSSDAACASEAPPATKVAAMNSVAAAMATPAPMAASRRRLPISTFSQYPIDGEVPRMHKQLGALFLRFALLVVAAGLIAATAGAQLNEKCTVSVLNRTTQARSDGSWVLPEVPANAGLVRARATCVENGITRSGQSNLFLVPINGVIDNVSISFTNPTPIPVSLTLNASLSTLTVVGSTSQLSALAVYPGAITRDVTAGSGTTYFTSNPVIATVTDTGRVTARGTGTALLSALHEGALGMTRITISTTGEDR